jgi:hypothetical protein
MHPVGASAPPRQNLAPTTDREGIAAGFPPQHSSAVLAGLRSKKKPAKKEPAATISAAAGFAGNREEDRHQEPAKWAAQDSNL